MTITLVDGYARRRKTLPAPTLTLRPMLGAELHVTYDSGSNEQAWLFYCGGTPIIVFAGREAYSDAEECAAEYCASNGMPGLCSRNPEDIGLDAETLEEAEAAETLPEGYGMAGSGEWYAFSEFTGREIGWAEA